MSKKKRRKFYNSPNYRPAQPSNVPSANNSDATPGTAAVSNSSFSTPSFSPAPTGTIATPNVSDAHAEEYRVIKHDLIKVVILNTVFLAAVLTLYYTNLHSHYLERWFGQILHF